MPQMNKGGNFILGESVICHNGLVHLPSQAVEEYRIATEGKVYLFTGSKCTGGFCITRQELLLSSKLGHILTETPELLHYEVPARGHSSPTKGAPVVGLRFRKQEQFNSQKNAEFSASGTRIAAFIHLQQRYCLYHGGKGAAAGKGRTFPGRNSSVLKNERSKST